jgi:hypothetical protein
MLSGTPENRPNLYQIWLSGPWRGVVVWEINYFGALACILLIKNRLNSADRIAVKN